MDSDGNPCERRAAAKVQASTDSIWASRKNLKLCRSAPLMSYSTLDIHNQFQSTRIVTTNVYRRSCSCSLQFRPPVGNDWLHSSLSSYDSRNLSPTMLTDWSRSSSRVLSFFKLLFPTPPPGPVRSVQPGPSRPVRPGWCRISFKKKSVHGCHKLWKPQNIAKTCEPDFMKS